jgi:hypothetical protein
MRRVVEVALSQGVDLGVRGTRTSRGGSHLTFLGRGGHVLGVLTDKRRAEWFHSGAGISPGRSAGVERRSLGFGKELDGRVGVVGAKAKGLVGGVATVREVPVGLEPVDNVFLKILLFGHPSDLLEFEVNLAVVHGDVLGKLGDPGSNVSHFAFEVVIIAFPLLPVLGNEGDEDLVVPDFIHRIVVRVGGENVKAKVHAGGAIVRDEPQGFGYHRVGVDVAELF